MPLFNQEIRSKQSTRTKIGRVVRSEGGYVDVIAVGGNTVIQKVKTGGLSPNVGDYVTIVFHSDGEKQAIPISSKEQVTSSSSVMASGSSGGGGAFTAGNGLSTTVGGVTNVNVVSGRTQITSNAVDVSTSLLPTPLVGEIGRVAYVSATGQLSYSSTLSLNGVQVIISGTSARIMGDFSSSPRVNRTLFQSSTTNGASNVGAIPNGSGTSSAFTSFGSSDPDNSKGVQISGTSTEAFVNSFQTSSGTLSAFALLFKINSSEAARFTANKAFLVGKTSQVLADSLGNVEINDSLWIGNLLKIAGATSGLATIQAAATVTPTLTLPSTTGTLALASDITSAISGTSGKIPKFTGTNSIGDSSLSVTGASMSALNINAGLSASRTSSNTLLSLAANAITSGYTGSVDFQALSGDGGGATMTIYSGTTAGTGYVTLQPALRLSGSTSGATLIKANAVAGSGTLTLPTATGTLALVGDITSAISGTTGTIPKFTGTNAIGNSILTESGTLVTSSGGLKATTTLNAGSGSNRNTAYSLDIKTADLALATPTGSWAFNYSWGGPDNGSYDQKVRIWAYKVVGGRQIFSAGYLELSGTDNGVGGSWYHMDVTLNPVTGADGYYIRLIDETWNYGSGLTGFYWYSTSTGTFVYDIGNVEWDGEPLTYNMPEIPVTPSAAYMDIIAGNYSLQHRGPLLLAGLTSGQINLWPPDVAGNNIIYLPYASGTIALLSDIPTSHTGTGTNGKIVKWTGALSQGDSILSESGSALTIGGSAMLTLTTEQMRWRYDTSNWVALTIGSSGLPSFAYSTSTPSWDWGYTNFKFKQETTPAGPTAADSGVAGNPNGTYRYKVTLNTAQGNTGWYANLSNSITVTSKKINLTGIPTGTTGVVTSRSIYRNANGLGVYKFVATINDNTTTTYQDNTADASLGGAIGAFNTTGGKFSTGPSGTTDVMWLHQAGVVVSGLTIGAGSLPGGYFTFPYSQNIQSMNSTGDGYVNVLGVGASGINFGAGFSMGNQGITNLYSLSFYATGRISTAAGGGNYDMELNNNAGGTGKLKWFGGSGTYHMNILDNAGGGYAGFGSNLTPTSRLHVDGSFATTGTAKSANFTVDANASAYYVTTGSAADITATLVAASTCNGREYIFVKVDSGTKDIVITRAGSDTINGATTLNVGTAQWSRVIIKSDGTNWVRIA